MDCHAADFYRQYSDLFPQGRFHRVVALHDAPDIDWREISKMVPSLCKGWFELAHLPTQDRISFTRDYWLSKLAYFPSASKDIDKFFSTLDDVGIYIIQPKFEDPLTVQMVYSLSNDGGFFHGEAAASQDEIFELQRVYGDYILPLDYLAFLQIHNGFSKWTDTGIIKIADMKESYHSFQDMLENEPPLVNSKGETINPKALIPFYKSFGMAFYQCFFADWYPDQEMGNVYYSSETKSISDIYCADCATETMAFESFTEWLTFYLEKID